ncbi:MAG: GntR family transcriptional regulator [Paenibacillus sp.]|uniref:GntR family transcriptional regulator n=1 Tax=Paenibacillus timonensis TaxID=225915 RepID=A0ABW3SAV4_9BACL|nr:MULTISPECIES: GntR family transcriptional regulator [Paenibacillus]MCH1640274.1 GntR family transcriptional regulator [Paenibacillus timonensis]MDU4697211.1 GntR family transcriptional regulator [Paenibacillus sp.]
MSKVEKASLTDQVYRRLKDMIVYGELQAGETIHAGDLAEQFQTSKTPIRDAINILNHEGLVEIIPFKGCLVSQVNLKDLDELISLRLILEGGAAELAASYASRQAIDKMEQLVGADIPPQSGISEVDYMRLNFDFHAAVAEASNNGRLKKLIINNLDNMQRVLYLDMKIGSTNTMNDEHREIVEMIKNKDPQAARKRMIEHILGTRNRIFSSQHT